MVAVEPDSGAWPIDRLVAWAGILETDRQDVVALLAERPADSVASQMERLRTNLGVPGGHTVDHGEDEFSWIAALIWFIPEQARWYAEHGVSEEIGRATVADIGDRKSVV